MWDSLFEVRKDLEIFQAKFEKSELKKELSKISFVPKLILEFENRVHINFWVGDADFFRLSFEIEFENSTMYVYFVSGFKTSVIKDMIRDRIFKAFKDMIEKSESDFILIFEGDEVNDSERILVDHNCYLPIGKKAQVVFELLKQIELTTTSSPWYSFSIKNSIFHQGLLFISWKLEESPCLEVIYSDYKDTNQFMKLKQNKLRKIKTLSELFEFTQWIEEIKKDTESVSYEIYDRYKEKEKKVMKRKNGPIIPELLTIEIQPAIKNYTVGYVLTSPYYTDHFFREKNDLIQATNLDYIATKMRKKANKEIVETAKKHGLVADTHRGAYIAKCYGESIEFRIDYEIDNEIIVYSFEMNRNKESHKTFLSENIDDLILKSSEGLEKYLHSIRLRKVFNKKDA